MHLLSSFVLKIGVLDSDSEGLKMQKNFLVYLTLCMSLGGIIMGSIAFSYNLINQTVIPYGYVLISCINIFLFAANKNFTIARGIQIFLSLLLPFMFQWVLGGFAASGVMMLWAVLALLASLTFRDTFEGILWLLMFITLTVASALFDETFKLFKPEVLPPFSLVFLVVNIITIVTIIFFLVGFFIKQSIKTSRNLKETVRNLEQQNRMIRRTAIKRIQEAEKKHEASKMRDERNESTWRFGVGSS